MKRLLTIAIFLFTLICFTQSAQAQKYLTFETKEFSVMLKCSSDYTKVIDISFSENGAWVSYKIVKTLPWENKASGNRYVVVDKKSNNYTIEYVYVKDKEVLKSASCSVVNQKTKIRTSLQRKK
ncbi:MAG: hypothetical protein WCI31_06340 [Prolixibacteraceae bacterium]